MALTKDNIVDRLVETHGLVRREALDIVDTFFDDIKTKISRGERVRLSNTGAFFKKKQRYHRKRRDVELSEDNAPWTTIAFKPAGLLKQRIQRATIELSRDID